MERTIKLGLAGAMLSMALTAGAGAASAQPSPTADAAPSGAQALASSRGVQLIQARWYHHRWRRHWGYAYARPYWWRHRHWRHRYWYRHRAW